MNITIILSVKKLIRNHIKIRIKILEPFKLIYNDSN